MAFAIKISNISSKDDAGPKAYYLSLATKNKSYGAKTAEGFVITKEAFEAFLSEKTKLKIKNLLRLVDINNKPKTQAIANSIQKILLSNSLPHEVKAEIVDSYNSLAIESDEILSELASKKELRVVLRASPVVDEKAYFPEHYLNFLDIANEEELIKKLKLCWASLFTAKAIEDRAKEGITEQKDYSMAVIVQKALNFSSSARVEVNEKSISISAVFGNLKAIENEDYDVYVVDRETGQIKEKKTGKQEFMVVINSGLKKLPLGDRGKMQKISSNTISRISSIASAISSDIRSSAVVDFGITEEKAYVLGVYKIDIEKERERDKEKIIENIIESPREEEKEITLTTANEGKEEMQTGISELSSGEKKSLFSDIADFADPLFSIFKKKREENKEKNVDKEKNKDSRKDGMALEADENRQKTSFKDHEIQTEMQTLLVEDKNKDIGELYYELSKTAVVCDMAISKRLRERHSKLFDHDPGFFDDIIEELKSKTEVLLEEDIKKVRALRNKFIEQGKGLRIEEIFFCIRTAERFLKEF